MIWKNHNQNIQYDQVPVVVRQEEPTYLMPTAAAAYAMAELCAFRNNLTAALARQTMDNVSLLAMHEAQLFQEAPRGAEQYRQIVQEYTNAALMTILGGECE